MTVQRDHKRIVVGWVSDLVNLTAGSAPMADAKQKITAIADAIAAEFTDPTVFTKDSLYFVSRKCPFFPRHAELAQHLTEWWDQNRPRVLSLATPEHESLSDEDQQWILNWQRHAMLRDLKGSQLTDRLKRLQKYRPAAFAWIVLNDPEAARIAAAAGLDDWHTGEATEDERQMASESAQRAIQAIAATPLRTPRSASVDDQRRSVEIEPPPPRKLEDLSPQELAELRRQRGFDPIPPPKKAAPRPANDEPTFDIGADGEPLWTPPWMAQAAE